MKTISMFFALFSILYTSILYSQNSNEKSRSNSSLNLNGTHSIYLLSGLKMNSSTNASATTSGIKAETNFVGSLGYQYWFDNEWSVNATLGFFQAKSNINFPNISTVSIIPILFGFSYYPESLFLGTVGRVHFGINAGVYIGSGTKTGLSLNNFGSSSITETVFGIEPNAGIDFFVAKWLKVGPVISYHFIGDFKELVRDNYNYSGAVFSVTIGVLL